MRVHERPDKEAMFAYVTKGKPLLLAYIEILQQLALQILVLCF